MLRELNDNEMEEASGGFANLAFGAAVGAFGYLVINGATGQGYSLAGFATATALGAATTGLGTLAAVGRLAVGTNVGGAAVTGMFVGTGLGVLRGNAILEAEERGRTGTVSIEDIPTGGYGGGGGFGGGGGLGALSFGGFSYGGGGGGGGRSYEVIITDVV